jgi:hypothetical protein
MVGMVSMVSMVSLPLTAATGFCSIIGTSSLFGANLNFMQSG